MGVKMDAPPPSGLRRFSSPKALDPGDLVAFADDDGTLGWLRVESIEPVDHGIGFIISFTEHDLTVRASHTTRLDTIKPEAA